MDGFEDGVTLLVARSQWAASQCKPQQPNQFTEFSTFFRHLGPEPEFCLQCFYV